MNSYVKSVELTKQNTGNDSMGDTYNPSVSCVLNTVTQLTNGSLNF